MRRALQLFAGLAISAVALWFTLRGKDLGAIWEAIRTADYRYLVPFLSVLLAIHAIRTVRWGILLEPVAKVPFARLNSVCAVGFMLLMILPFRLGELARPYLIADRRNGPRVSAALSSVVVERVADGIFTALLLVLTLLAIPEGAPHLRLLRITGALVFLGFVALLAILVIAYRNRALAVRITHRVLDPISSRLAERVAGMMDRFIEGLRLVPSRGKLVLFFFLTFAYWALNAWGMKVLARGFGLDLAPLAALTLLGVLVVGVMIPAGPGNVGTFQAAVVLGLSLVLPRSVVDTQGNAFANVLWAAQLAQFIALGLPLMFSRHIRLDRVFGPHARPSEDTPNPLDQQLRLKVDESAASS
jgi:uncharacterized protein (TIRG00374 family)